MIGEFLWCIFNDLVVYLSSIMHGNVSCPMEKRMVFQMFDKQKQNASDKSFRFKAKGSKLFAHFDCANLDVCFYVKKGRRSIKLWPRTKIVSTWPKLRSYNFLSLLFYFWRMKRSLLIHPATPPLAILSKLNRCQLIEQFSIETFFLTNFKSKINSINAN